jgi:hypothetical protein
MLSSKGAVRHENGRRQRGRAQCGEQCLIADDTAKRPANHGKRIDIKKAGVCVPALRAIAGDSALIFIGAPRPAGLRFV